MSLQELFGLALLAGGFMTSVVLRTGRFEAATTGGSLCAATRFDGGGHSLRRPNYLRHSSRPPKQVCRT